MSNLTLICILTFSAAAQYFRGDIRLFIDLNQWLNGTDTVDGRTLLKAEFRNAVSIYAVFLRRTQEYLTSTVVVL